MYHKKGCGSPKPEPTWIEYVGDVGPPREKQLPRALPQSILVLCFA